MKIKKKRRPTRDELDELAPGGLQGASIGFNKSKNLELKALKNFYKDFEDMRAAFALLGWDRSDLNHLKVGLERILEANGANLGSEKA